MYGSTSFISIIFSGRENDRLSVFSFLKNKVIDTPVARQQTYHSLFYTIWRKNNLQFSLF